MKRSNWLRFSFGALTVLAAICFAACVDDNADEGMPYLQVSPPRLFFDAEGQAPSTGSDIVIKTNRPWKLTLPEGITWVTPSATSGEADATVAISVSPSRAGRSTKLTVSLQNSYGAYLSEEVSIEQGELGDVSRLVAYIKEAWPNLSASAANDEVDLNYTEPVEGVILANNSGGNNRSKIYVGDNIESGNSAIILYDQQFNTVANYPVGSRVTLDLSNAKYQYYYGLRELKGVEVTVSTEVEEVVVPQLTVAQFNSGDYQGQYVEVLDVTTPADKAGADWVTSSAQTLTFTSGSASLAVRMSQASDATAFAGLQLNDNTGSIRGTAEQFNSSCQLMPVTPADIEAFYGVTAGVTTAEPVIVSATAATLGGSYSALSDVTECGVEYTTAASTESVSWDSPTVLKAASTEAEWTVEATELTTDQLYAVRAYAKAASETIYGAVKFFTPSDPATITVDFSDANAYPADFPTSSATKIVEPTKYTFAGYDFTLAGGGSDNGFYRAVSSGAYYVIFGKQGAYVELPALEGKSLTRVRATARSGASGNVQVGVTDTAGTTVEGGDYIKWVQEDPYQYNYQLGGTSVNTAYRLQIENGYNAQLTKLELWYAEGGTPAKPTVTVTPSSLHFDAEGDPVGKEVTITTTNDDGLTLKVDNSNPTQFTATLEGKTLTVKANPNTNPTQAQTAELTVYLADGGDRKAEAKVTVTQASQQAKTISELVTEMRTMSNNGTFSEGWVGQTIEGYIAASNENGNLNQALSVVDNTGAAGSGVFLYSSTSGAYPAADFPVGHKITLTITESTKLSIYNGFYELVGAEAKADIEGPAVEMKVPEVTLADLADNKYDGMYVKVKELKRNEETYVQWNATSGNQKVNFVNGSNTIAVQTYVGCSWAKQYVSPTATGSVTGVVEESNGTKLILPQSADDVKDFEVTAPTIVAFTPATLTLPAEGGQQTVSLTLINNDSGSAVTTSGLTSPFSVEVGGEKNSQTVTVKAEANSGDAVDLQTLTISVPGGNSVEVHVGQLASGQTAPKEYEEIATVEALTAGDYFFGGYAQSKFCLCSGTTLTNNHVPTAQFEYKEETGTLTPDSSNSSAVAVAITLEAVPNVDNAYKIILGGKYLTATAASSGKLSLVESTDLYWSFTNHSSGGIKAVQVGTTAAGAQLLISTGTDSNVIRSGASSTSGNGLRFYKKNQN